MGRVRRGRIIGAILVILATILAAVASAVVVRNPIYGGCDFGSLVPWKSNTRHLRIWNLRPRRVVVSGVQSSCACTFGGELAGQEILPFRCVKTSVTLDTSTSKPGPYSSVIALRLRGDPRVYSIPILGFVRQGSRLAPPSVEFQVNEIKSWVPRKIELLGDSETTRISDIEYDRAALSVESQGDSVVVLPKEPSDPLVDRRFDVKIHVVEPEQALTLGVDVRKLDLVTVTPKSFFWNEIKTGDEERVLRILVNRPGCSISLPPSGQPEEVRLSLVERAPRDYSLTCTIRDPSGLPNGSYVSICFIDILPSGIRLPVKIAGRKP